MNEEPKIESLFEIVRVFSETSQGWLPAIKDAKSHDMNPLWVASIMYLIYDRYMSNVDDEHQNEFSSQLFFYFEKIKENGFDYVHKIKSVDEIP